MLHPTFLGKYVHYKKLNLRAIAALLIAEVIDKHRSLNDVLPQYKKKCANEEDAALLQAMAFGVLRFYPRLQFIATQLLKKPFKPKDEIVLYLITLGIYQLTELRIPDYAALSETVEASRQLQKPWAAALINATLREFQRNSETLLAKAQNNTEAWYSHPVWLFNMIKAAWPDQWQSILEANNAKAPLVLRINQQVCSREDYLNQLLEQNIQAMPLPFPTTALCLETAKDVKMLPGYLEGAFSVQDAASQTAAFLLELTPNLKVLDACAAPGGKACHILESMPSTDLLAVDIVKERTEKIKENLQRLKLKAKVITEDVLNLPHLAPLSYFDRILLDAPCSATGVIRRHPDIKYLRRPEDIQALATQQFTVLQTLWPLLKPGGILLYATCSILPMENQLVVEKFINCQTDAVLLPIPLEIGTSLLEIGVSLTAGIQILPGQNEMDGFYYARIGKKI